MNAERRGKSSGRDPVAFYFWPRCFLAHGVCQRIGFRKLRFVSLVFPLCETERLKSVRFVSSVVAAVMRTHACICFSVKNRVTSPIIGESAVEGDALSLIAFIKRPVPIGSLLEIRWSMLLSVS